MTLLEAIRKSADFLASRGVESPRLHAELLLAHVLKLPRLQLYLQFDRQLSEPETSALRDLVKRRGKREPLQHIVGSTSFCGHEIRVGPDVLIPRPETELLAEAGWKFLQTLAAEGAGVTALDWGTGSGCIAIALAAQCASARVYATDTSSSALRLARENAAANGVEPRIEFLECSGLEELPGGFACDLVVSNPPYIPTAEIEGLEPEVRDFDPRLALDGGPDGLEWPRRLAKGARALLSNRGRLLLEFGDGQERAVQSMFEEQNWIVESIQEDYTHRPRILSARPAPGQAADSGPPTV